MLRGDDKHPNEARPPTSNEQYKATQNPPIEFRQLEQLATDRPQSTELDPRISGLEDYANSSERVLYLIRVLDKQPDDTEVQDLLSEAYTQIRDPSRALEGWNGLVTRHPMVDSLVKRLAQAHAVIDDPDATMSTWWVLLKSNPSRFVILKEFWNACSRRRGLVSEFGSSIPGLLYFIWLCLLNWISDYCLEYGIEDIDWWPLATEDDIMNIRPNMVKSGWFCVFSFLNVN